MNNKRQSMNTCEIFRDWWQTIAAAASAIAAVLTFWLGEKKDRSANARVRRKVVSIIFGIVVVSLVLWQVSARESAKAQKTDDKAANTNSPRKSEQQVTVSGSNSGEILQISGSVGGSVLGSGSTQIVSNTTNNQVDDHRSQSPTLASKTISNSGTLSIGAQVNSGNTENNSRNQINTGGGDVTFGDKNNSGDGSGNNISNGSGKVLINGDDKSRDITGSNTGIIIQGDSNSTVINVWMNSSEFKFSSNGTFSFPDNPSTRMAELKKFSQTEEFKKAMRPFAALGTFQPERAGSVIRLWADKTGSVPKPISYRRLYEIGALQSDTKSQEYLVKMATSRDAMRPRWPMRSYAANTWIQNPEQTTLVHDAQKFINTYHEEMVQLGMLSE